MAFGIPVFVFGIIWILVVPKNAKTMFWAKVFRQTVFWGASDSGQMVAYRGHTEGPGIFRSSDGMRIDFIPRSSEGWINKTFHGDKIPYLIGYLGKAVAASYETVAVLTLNQELLEHRETIKTKLKKMVNKEKQKHPLLTPVEMDIVLKDFLNTNPEAVVLVDQLKKAQANIATVKTQQHKTRKDEQGNPLRRKIKEVKRRVAILLDSRILQWYITSTLQPSQSRHVHDIGYRQGYRDGSNPMAKFKMVLILLVIAIPIIAVVLLLLLGSGGTAAVA